VALCGCLVWRADDGRFESVEPGIGPPRALPCTSTAAAPKGPTMAISLQSVSKNWTQIGRPSNFLEAIPKGPNANRDGPRPSNRDIRDNKENHP
jgi:hypothetical protein